MFTVNLNVTVGRIGSILWMQNYNPPAGNLTVLCDGADFQTRVFVLSYEETMQWVGYSLTTGALLWGPTTSLPNDFNYYSTSYTYASNLAYGNIYFMGYAGVLYCFSDLTGKIQWTYGNGPMGSDNSTNAGFNTPYGDYPTNIESVADGVVYISTEMHTISDPIYKGCTAAAINATNGQLIWGLSDYCSEWTAPGSSWVVADGYATFMNGYNNQIYSVGRGPSATTIQAPQTTVTAGTNVVIQGTVMDTSAGTKQSQQLADFPNGVPCASDASMQAWMGYVYQQQPEPTNFTGVTVTLTAIDPNGNFVSLGTATTDSSGLYHYTWTPPSIPGNYLVTATFAGTNGYWGSRAETAMTVQGTTSATAAPTATPASVANVYFVPAIAGLFVLIIIVLALVILMMLRKRP